MPQSLHNRLVDPLSLLACLRVIHGTEKLFGPQYFAKEVKELGKKLLLVVGWNVLRGAVRVERASQKCSGHRSCRGVPKRDALRHFGKPVCYNQNGSTFPRAFFNEPNRFIATNLKGLTGKKSFNGF